MENPVYERLKVSLTAEPKVWLVTGVAGFIGSNLLAMLLRLNQRVVGLDNFSTGHQSNLDEVQSEVTREQWENFRLVRGDTRELEMCRQALFLSDGRAERNVDYVLHQAALGSVPRSLDDPIGSHRSNVDGFLNMLVAARDAGVKAFVYAASSSTYGDHPDLPKVEERIGRPLSPYAVTKYVNELYAEVFARCYGFRSIGLRYFNVFGRRQDPQGPYAAVIPKWVVAMLRGEPVCINGDGETSRDFCYIENAVQANLLAAMASDTEVTAEVYNIAVGESTSLNELYRHIREALPLSRAQLKDISPDYGRFRVGDVRHSLADVSKAKRGLGYLPTHRVEDGLRDAVVWYARQLNKSGVMEP